MSFYNYTGTELSSSDGDSGSVLSTGVIIVTDGLPTGWAYNACWVYVKISDYGANYLLTLFITGITLTAESSTLIWGQTPRTPSSLVFLRVLRRITPSQERSTLVRNFCIFLLIQLDFIHCR